MLEMTLSDSPGSKSTILADANGPGGKLVVHELYRAKGCVPAPDCACAPSLEVTPTALLYRHEGCRD